MLNKEFNNKENLIEINKKLKIELNSLKAKCKELENKIYENSYLNNNNDSIVKFKKIINEYKEKLSF